MSYFHLPQFCVLCSHVACQTNHSLHIQSLSLTLMTLTVVLFVVHIMLPCCSFIANWSIEWHWLACRSLANLLTKFLSCFWVKQHVIYCDRREAYTVITPNQERRRAIQQRNCYFCSLYLLLYIDLSHIHYMECILCSSLSLYNYCMMVIGTVVFCSSVIFLIVDRNSVFHSFVLRKLMKDNLCFT